MGSGSKGSGKSREENKHVARLHHPLSVRVPAPRCPPTSPRSRLRSLNSTSHTEREAERARGERNCFRGTEQDFRERVAEDGRRFGRGALPAGPCCCEPLGGGWPRLCGSLRSPRPMRPLGGCACAVRSGPCSSPPSLQARAFPLGVATHLSITEPPSYAHYPDPLTLPSGCTPQTSSGSRSDPLTSPRRPSDPAPQALGSLEARSAFRPLLANFKRCWSSSQ